jgi:predicted small secreted protein
MRRLITALLAAAALALTGCGSDSAEPTGAGADAAPPSESEPSPEPEATPPSEPEPAPTSEPEPSPSPEPEPSTEPATEVRSVTVTQSGGIAGGRQTWQVGPSDPGHRAVFDAAEPQALEGAKGSTGKPPCCDLFQYHVTVRYSDGTVESFRVYDGAAADPALTHLVSAVVATQPQPSSGPTYR